MRTDAPPSGLFILRGKNRPAGRGAGGLAWPGGAGRGVLGPHPLPGLSPAALTPGNCQRPFRSPSPNSTVPGRSPRARRHAEDARGSSASSANSQSQSRGGPPPPPLMGAVMGTPRGGRWDSTPRTQECGHRRRVKRGDLSPLRAQGRAPWGGEQGARGGPTPSGQDAKAPPRASSRELTLPRQGDICPHSTDSTPRWESRLSQSFWKMCLRYIK